MGRREAFPRGAGQASYVGRPRPRREASGRAPGAEVAFWAPTCGFEAKTVNGHPTEPEPKGMAGRLPRWRPLALAVTGLSMVALAVSPSSQAAARPAGAASLALRALSSFQVRADWSVPPDAATVRILRDGRLVDEFPAGAGTSYRDSLLWASTSYAYEVVALDAAGGELSDETATVTTPAQVGSFPRLYAKTSFWNRPIPRGATIDPNSAAIVAASILPTAGIATFNTNDQWGIPIAYANRVSEQYDVGCLYFGCGTQVLFRIPRYAQPNIEHDGKLVVVDPALNVELDMGRAAYDPVADTWTSGSRYTTPSNGWGAMCGMGQRCSGVLMSGLDQFGGVIRPEEIAQGHIDHALALVAPYWRSTVVACPAVKWSGGFDDPNAIPMSARIQLDPAFDVDGQTWPQWQKIVAKALQRYGAYVTDAGSDRLDIRGEAILDRGYDPWANVGVPSELGQASLNALPWDRVWVLTITEC
jgi:hypothetical protein